ncbi:MAG: hypothetical protein ACETWM_12830 [Candidatus Lokiarchaeia archaeon]
MEKTQKSTEQKNKENTSQKNPLEFKIDPREIGIEKLYPCCIDGSCSLYFYYEEQWKEQQQKQKNETIKQNHRQEGEK